MENDWRPIIFFRPYERRSIAEAALKDSPVACRRTIKYADRICGGKIDIFDELIDFRRGLDWATDHSTGRTWPRVPAAQVPIIYADDRSDIKVPWELARFQFLSHLGRAWVYTGDNKYPRLARYLVESFMADNPPGIGLHWVNPMEAAIRAANWIAADSWFSGADEWDNDFRDQLKLSLYNHGRFILSHLERDGRGINNNHYTANLAGLFMLGLYLHDVGEGACWLDFALNELDTEIHRQIAPDGMHYENSIGYHRLTFEMFFYTHRLAQINRINPPINWQPILEKMAEFTLGITTPSGAVPNFGDNDDGLWLAGTPRRPDDHQYLVGLAAAAFGRPNPWLIQFPHDETPEEIYWYLGVETAHTLNELRGRNGYTSYGIPPTDIASGQSLSTPVIIGGDRRQLSSQVFGSSGMIVMRSDDAYVLATANPVGTGGIGGHKHNDLLSFIFSVGNREIVIDPGTYAYTADPMMRNQLRGTAAHNTVVIDGTEQNRFVARQLFWVRQDAQPRIAHCHLNKTLDRLTNEHDGYRRLPGKITHRRHFTFHKTENILVVCDELTGSGIHDIQATYNLGPGTINADDPHRLILQPGRNGRRAGFLIDDYPCRQVDLEPGWRSVYYRQKTPSFRVVQRGRAQLPVSWTTVIGVFDGAVDWPRLEQARDEVTEGPLKKFPGGVRWSERRPVEVC
ncbi:heparinase II/III family protein [Candidatus Zixiibacteriota bacterium]